MLRKNCPICSLRPLSGRMGCLWPTGDIRAGIWCEFEKLVALLPKKANSLVAPPSRFSSERAEGTAAGFFLAAGKRVKRAHQHLHVLNRTHSGLVSFHRGHPDRRA